MDIVPLLDAIGEPQTAALGGLLVGMVFGIAAQRSSFCLRAATVEFARGILGGKVSVWLLTFSTALIWTQAAELAGYIETSDARILAVPGSYSGAIIGGLMFGVGMVLSRGCSGRLLVLAATGNLRSVMSGLIFAVVAQMSLHGYLAPLRNKLAAIWVTPDGSNVQFLDALGLPDATGLIIGVISAMVALYISWRNRVSWHTLFMASGVGFSVALGWFVTSTLAAASFEPVAMVSATFTGPSANTLMYFLSPNPALNFDIGLVPGAFLGAFLAAAFSGQLKMQGFDGPRTMRRSMIGAAFMGFGGMLAGGCAIGNGVTGASVFAITAWLALLCMWIGAAIADLVVDQWGWVCSSNEPAHC